MFEILELDELLGNLYDKASPLDLWNTLEDGLKEVATAQRDADLKELNEWKCKPDSEGWWWFEDNHTGKTMCEVKQIHDEPEFRIYFHQDQVEFYMSEITIGKWCKTYVP
jgi:hypothetical protein